jgi:hypothetical protein
MSGKLTLVEEIPPVADTEAALVPQGRLAKAVAKTRTIWQRIKSSPTSTQLWGIGPASWLAGFLASMIILNTYVSPVITDLAMTTLIAPIAALFLSVLGEFDFTKLTTMVTSNVGIVFGVGGGVIAALFVQNVVKMSLFLKSFSPFSDSHRQYRTEALASVLTPITTSAFWTLAVMCGYFWGAKTISLGVLAMFASGALGEVLKNVDPMNASITDLATVANVMSGGLRWGIGFLMVVHLTFVFISYGQIHKLLKASFDFIAKGLTREKIGSKMYVQSVDRDNKPRFNDKNEPVMEPTGFGRITMAVTVIGVIVGLFWAGSHAFSDTPEELQAKLVAQAAEEKSLLEKQLRVACVGGVTYATEGGKTYRLTNADKTGTSYCVAPLTEKMLRIGDEFSVGGSYRNNVVILDANGYGKDCRKSEYGRVYIDGSEVPDANNNCRKDRIVRTDIQYWLELPEGLPKDVKMPALPAPAK